MDTTIYACRDSCLVKIYGRCTYTATETTLKDRHKVYQAAEADRLFASGQYAECQQACYEVLEAHPSEAIQARCHMYLATEAVGPAEASNRFLHAESAMRAWQAVINRTSLSKFPIEEAKRQLAVTKQLLDTAANEEKAEPPLT